MSRADYLLNSVRYFAGRFVLGKKHMIARSPRYGLKMKFRSPDGGGRAIYKTGLYEEQLTQFLLQTLHLEEGDLVFDVGANIGWYSCVLSRHAPGAEIFCFEPDPGNFELLRWTLEKNASARVHPVQMGVGGGPKRGGCTCTRRATSVVTPCWTSRWLRDRRPGHQPGRVRSRSGARSRAGEVPEDRRRRLRILRLSRGPGRAEAPASHARGVLSGIHARRGGVEPADLLRLLHGHGFDPYSIDGLELVSRTDEELLDRDSNIDLVWLKKGHPL